MIKEKIKFIAVAILNTAFVIISAMGLSACVRVDRENVPSSFVCSETGLTIELSEDKSHYIVTDCPEDKTEVVILESYYGKPVKEIGEDAFVGCENLTKISIPDCMVSIKPKALSACINLEYTEAGDSKYLGNENNSYVYLAKCLSKDIITTVVESSCRAIGDYAFHGCNRMESISLPKSLTSIGNTAFYDCNRLERISLPEGLTSIGNSAFGYCGFSVIGLPSSLTYIGAGAFLYCQSLKSITIPNGITEIKANTFNGCHQLRSVKMGDNLTKIWEYAFANCDMRSVTIPNGVTIIGFAAFCSCSDLTRVSIPVSVTGIGPEAFSRCNELVTISFNGTKAQWDKITKGYMWDYRVSAEEITCIDGNVSLSENN